jgi:hypothetical protein
MSSVRNLGAFAERNKKGVRVTSDLRPAEEEGGKGCLLVMPSAWPASLEGSLVLPFIFFSRVGGSLGFLLNPRLKGRGLEIGKQQVTAAVGFQHPCHTLASAVFTVRSELHVCPVYQRLTI